MAGIQWNVDYSATNIGCQWRAYAIAALNMSLASKQAFIVYADVLKYCGCTEVLLDITEALSQKLCFACNDYFHFFEGIQCVRQSLISVHTPNSLSHNAQLCVMCLCSSIS